MRVHITAFTFSVVDGDYSPLSIVATVLLVLATTIVVLRRLGRHAQSTAFVDTHVHLWDAACLPPWLGDPALKPIACTRSVSDHAAAAGPGLAKAVYMEVDVAPEHRDDEARRIVALCEDAENALCGAVIGAPVVDGTLDEFTAYVRRWATHDAVKGVRQVLHIHPRGTCLRDDVVAKARLCGELGLVFELCMRCDELDDAARLADRVPGCRFVLDRTAGSAASKRRPLHAALVRVDRTHAPTERAATCAQIAVVITSWLARRPRASGRRGRPASARSRRVATCGAS